MTGAPAKAPSGPGRWQRRLRWTLRQVEHCLALFGVATVLYFCCFSYSHVISFSMQPTLQGTCWEDGDRILTEKVSFRFRSPRRWEVIAFRQKDGMELMKRVMGLPGEKVQMLRGGRILIDGQQITPPAELGFLDYFPYGNLIEGRTCECGNGYYVLGDYSRDSDDSRFNGPVSPDQFIGRPWLIVGPAGRRGFVR